jgi:hypothetical protein
MFTAPGNDGKIIAEYFDGRAFSPAERKGFERAFLQSGLFENLGHAAGSP